VVSAEENNERRFFTKQDIYFGGEEGTEVTEQISSPAVSDRILDGPTLSSRILSEMTGRIYSQGQDTGGRRMPARAESRNLRSCEFRDQPECRGGLLASGAASMNDVSRKRRN
jgi:hypothetical protein